ncbi:MAG TPA: amidohydrolase, partial [Gemmatimonadaceae bacterium]
MRQMHRVTIRSTLVLACVGLGAANVTAQNPPSRDTTPVVGGPTNKLPLKPTRVVRFTTDEGTWVSLDVSPDGRTILFELLGDLYTLPIGGGKATRISDGPQFDWGPRYSPDGKTIVFVSDRSGTQNVWLADADGSHPRALTTSPTNQYLSPEWTPDGQYVVVSQAARRFAPYELFLIDPRGGSGVKISTANANHVGVAFGADDRYVFYYTGGGFGSWQVQQLDRRTGRSSPVTAARGGGLRPVVSPDGRYLVYATRRDAVTVLMLRDIATGEQHVLVPEAARDEQERLDQRDLMPGSSFTPDSKALITSYGGKIWRV